MNYSLIDWGKAPEPKARPASSSARMSVDLVNSLTPDNPAPEELFGKETPRGVKVSITRAAKRTAKTVRSRDIDGTVYAELVKEPPAPPPHAGGDDTRPRSQIVGEFGPTQPHRHRAQASRPVCPMRG